MKIGQITFQTTTSKQSKKEKIKESTFEQKLIDAREAINKMMQEQISEIKEAQTSMGENDPKAQQIIAKFKNGKKLTREEMAYLRIHAPGIIPFIERIAREREIIERGMKMARSKTEVQMVVYHAAKLIDKCTIPEEREIRAKQLADAKQEYEKTEEYKEKPNNPLEEEKKTIKIRYKQKQPAKMLKTAYEQVKLQKSESTIEYNL